MRIPRVYCSEELISGRELLLAEDASAHLLRVLRLKSGAALYVFDGLGQEFSATLTQVIKHRAGIQVGEPCPRQMESALRIHLGQGISRGEKMDYTIQKAVELGVHKITPLFTQFSGVNLSGPRLEKRLLHWQAVIVNACEQCGRNVLPVIDAPIQLEDWLRQCEAPLKFIMAPNGTKRLQDFTADKVGIALLTGPEGGFSPEEVLLAERAQFQLLRLGPRILRTETAAAAALAAMQCLWGDMG